MCDSVAINLWVERINTGRNIRIELIFFLVVKNVFPHHMHGLSFSQASSSPSQLQVQVAALTSAARLGETLLSSALLLTHPNSTCALPFPFLCFLASLIFKVPFPLECSLETMQSSFPIWCVPPSHPSPLNYFLGEPHFCLFSVPCDIPQQRLTFNYWCSGSLMSHGYPEGQMVDTIPYLLYKVSTD